MEAVRDLGRLRGSLPRPLGIRTRPIPRNHLDPGMLPQPLRHRCGRPIRQQRNGLAALQVHEDCANGACWRPPARGPCPWRHAPLTGLRPHRPRRPLAWRPTAPPVAPERAMLDRTVRQLMALAPPDRWPDTPLAHELTVALVALRTTLQLGGQ